MTGMGAGIGFAFGPLLTGFLFSTLHLNWRGVSLVFGCAAMAAGVAALFLLRDVPPEPHRAAANVKDSRPAQAPALSGKKAGPLGLSPALWGLLVFVISIAGTKEIALWTLLDISDFYLSGLISAGSAAGAGSSVNTAWLLFVMNLPGIFIQPLAGTLSDKIGRARLSVIALGLYGAGILSLTAAPAGLLIVCYLVMGAAQSATTPLLEAFVADYASAASRGVFFGVYITAITGIGALGPLLGGIFLDVQGRTGEAFRELLTIMGLMVMLGGLLMTLSKPLVRRLKLKTAE
jgi:MFS family permease